MGNNQSNEREPNYKIYKITKKNNNEDFIRLYLDDYVTYSDGDYKHFDFAKNSWETFITCNKYCRLGNVGDYVRIDLNMTREYQNSHSFDSGIGLVEGRVVEKVDSNGNIIREALGLVAGIGEIVGERQKHIALVEQSRYANQSWTKQTSWDMPPNWK